MAGDIFGCEDQGGGGGARPMGRVRDAGSSAPDGATQGLQGPGGCACRLAWVRCSLGLSALLPPKRGCVLCISTDFRGFGTFCPAVSSPSAPATAPQDLWPRDLPFSFIHSPPLPPPGAGGLLLWWGLGTGQGRQVTKQTDAVTEPPTLSQGGHGSRGSVEPAPRQSGEASWRKWCLRRSLKDPGGASEARRAGGQAERLGRARPGRRGAVGCGGSVERHAGGRQR